MGTEDTVLSAITAEEILKKSGLSPMDISIFIFRFMFGYAYQEIGEKVGTKYRGKPYTEGAIRYRLKKISGILEKFLESHS